MRRSFLTLVGLLAGAVLLLAGCETAPAGPPVAGQEKTYVRLPWGYRPLPGNSDCFVESVHFYDFYFENRLGGSKSWARILRWATRKDDFTLGPGHAVTVFFTDGRLWIYDINFGFLSLHTAPDRRMDLTDVAPEIFAKYTSMKSVFPAYEDDVPRPAPPAAAGYSPKGTTPEVQGMVTVANTLGKKRLVRLVEFNYRNGGTMQSTVAAVFIFGNKLCIYQPSTGTVVAPALYASAEDLWAVKQIVGQSFPGATGVHWYVPAG
jgi:hypothetical protein